MTPSSTPLTAPSRHSLILEARAALDVVRMVGPLVGAQLTCSAERDDLRVVVIPGFGADDHYTAPLRHFLKRRGFAVSGWGLGRNLAGLDLPHTLDELSPRWDFTPREPYRGEASVPYLCDRFIERLSALHEQDGRAIALIGWSLGGYLAREAARELPGIVDRVVTLGTPIAGGPKYTAAAKVFRRRGMDLDWIEAEIGKRNRQPLPQPVTAVYSKSDAIVAWPAAMDAVSKRIRHIEVNASHLGLVFNPTVWRHILEALAPTASGGVANAA